MKSLLGIVKSIYCRKLEQISIPPAEEELSKPIYTPAAVGTVGLPVPVNHPVVPVMFPVAVMVPFVDMLPVDEDIAICSVQVPPVSDPSDKPF